MKADFSSCNYAGLSALKTQALIAGSCRLSGMSVMLAGAGMGARSGVLSEWESQESKRKGVTRRL